MIAVIATATRARAADCPVAFGDSATNCDSVCTQSGSTWTCDVSSAGTVGRAVLVEDYSSDHDYEAWGDIDGDTFCCAIDEGANPIDTFLIVGSGQADTLAFTFNSRAYNLQPTSANAISASIQGASGDDAIQGSDYSGANYDETLKGEDDDDTIQGHAGDDELDGGAGADTMLGGPGADVMSGGADDDTMYGGVGADLMDGDDGDDDMSGEAGGDTMYGGGGADDMSGGDANDWMYGEGGSDEICGNGQGPTGGDTLHDGGVDGAVDYLWGAENVDTDNCMDWVTPTYWDGQAADPFYCGDIIYSPPAGCP